MPKGKERSVQLVDNWWAVLSDLIRQLWLAPSDEQVPRVSQKKKRLTSALDIADFIGMSPSWVKQNKKRNEITEKTFLRISEACGYDDHRELLAILGADNERESIPSSDLRRLSDATMQSRPYRPQERASDDRLGNELSDPGYHPGRNVDILQYYSLVEKMSFDKIVLPFELVWLSDDISIMPAFKLKNRKHKLPWDLDSYEKSFIKILNASRRRPIYNQRMIRLDSFSINSHGEAPIFDLSLTSYWNYISSNFSCEVALDSSGTTIRDKFLMGPHLLSFEEAVFSNHIGLNCALFTPDNELILPRKSGLVTHDPFTTEISISSAWKLYGSIERPQNVSVLEGYCKEGEEELGLSQDQIGNIAIIGLVRDLRKGGKPELFAVARTSLDFDSVQSKWERMEGRDSWEFDSIGAVRIDGFGIEDMRTIFDIPEASPNLRVFCAIAAGTKQQLESYLFG